MLRWSPELVLVFIFLVEKNSAFHFGRPAQEKSGVLMLADGRVFYERSVAHSRFVCRRTWSSFANNEFIIETLSIRLDLSPLVASAANEEFINFLLLF